MNKKGFTLIELLVVVILLSAIILLALPKITNSVNNYNTDVDEITYTLIKDATKLYIKDNSSLFPKKQENTYCISLNELIEEDYLKDKIEYNNNDITNKKVVKVTYDEKFNYEVVNKNSCVETAPTPVSFAEDDWETIVSNVRIGNLSKYNVGDTKEVTLEGFTNEEKDANGNNVRTYTVRIANTSNPEECNAAGFSQTACGFVVEFVDIITTPNMNSAATNVGGWKDSAMRTYVNNTIYNALPKELKDKIIDTTVVSGYGLNDAPNKVTTDKIYLLSTKEVWEQGTSNRIEYDTARELTRQLDYYKNYKNTDGSIGVTTDNYSGAIKTFDGSASYWWLRSANSSSTSHFYVVHSSGDWSNIYAGNTGGVAVAFRLG